jgi:hypothetical protein
MINPDIGRLVYPYAIAICSKHLPNFHISDDDILLAHDLKTDAGQG